MNWQAAIELNRDALLRVLAALVALAAPTLSRQNRNAILRVLRPAESAARRLIVIAARFCANPPRPEKTSSNTTLPDFTKFQQSAHIPSFKLFDPRKKFDLGNPKKLKRSRTFAPRISMIGVSNPIFAHIKETASSDGKMNAAPLTARLQALQDALSDLPKQAKRLARHIEKRKAAPAGPKRAPPLRPGLPPAYRSKPAHDVDLILKECHALALQAPEAPP